jgi:hypothetical protein
MFVEHIYIYKNSRISKQHIAYQMFWNRNIIDNFDKKGGGERKDELGRVEEWIGKKLLICFSL